jgi:hypothetical protein
VTKGYSRPVPDVLRRRSGHVQRLIPQIPKLTVRVRFQSSVPTDIAKDSSTYTIIFLRQDKTLRDHPAARRLPLRRRWSARLVWVTMRPRRPTGAGRLEDVLLFWGAKEASFDAMCSIDVQLLCGSGLVRTKTYLSERLRL